MGKEIKKESFNFAVRIVKMSKYLQEVQKEYILTKQVMRSGTSIGANIREAYNGESDADFVHKMSIAQKECSETLYWIELLVATDHLEEKAFQSIHSEATELYKIITSIILTKKKNMKKQA
jgi:four helix bundle protein